MGNFGLCFQDNVFKVMDQRLNIFLYFKMM